jgi:hypothetical protein
VLEFSCREKLPNVNMLLKNTAEKTQGWCQSVLVSPPMARSQWFGRLTTADHANSNQATGDETGRRKNLALAGTLLELSSDSELAWPNQ